MKPMQVAIDGSEVVPNVVKAVVTYVQPDTSGLYGPTVEIVVHLEKGKRNLSEIGEEAVRRAEQVLRDTLELD